MLGVGITMSMMAVWVLTTSSIAMESYEKNKDFWKGNTLRTNTRNFLIASLVLSIVALIIGILLIARSIMGQ